MSVRTNQPRGLNVPRPKPPIVPVTHDNVRDWWALLVNRKAYTRQSANPHPETGRHYHYQPKNKDSGQPLELDRLRCANTWPARYVPSRTNQFLFAAEFARHC